MREIELGNSGLRAPQLGFGCSALLGRSGKTESLRALAAAWDLGIRFFDTARSYGYGESEALLGDFLRGRREQAVIATKFGILATQQPGWKHAARAVARKVLAVMPAAHTMLQRRARSEFNPNQFTIPVLQQSVEESLRKLKTDYVDMLFLHAAPASVLQQEDLLEAMGRLVEAGKVRVAGLSADPDVVEMALKRRTGPLGAMQFPCNVFAGLVVSGIAQQNRENCILLANHPFGGVARVQQCRATLRKLAGGDSIDAVLRAKLSSINDSVLADLVLNTILRDTGIHIAIPSMMSVEHVRTNVRAVTDSRFDSAEIAEIRRALQAGTFVN